MGIQNEIEQSDIENKKIKLKESIKTDILNAIESSIYGLNISNLSENLKLSRNTVKKYLHHLIKKGLILENEIGRSKIYFSKKTAQKSNINVMRKTFFTILNRQLEIFEEISPKFIKDPYNFIKEFSSKLGQGYFPFLKIIKISKSDKNTINIDEVAEISLKFMNYLNDIFGEMYKIELVPKISKDQESSVIFRVEITSKEIKSINYFFYACAGFYERILRDKVKENISITILEIQEENSCCYYKLSIH